MDKKQTTDKRLSWFWRWFLNNQVVTALLIVLLVLLIILTFTKVSYLFKPVWQFFGVVGLPVIMAGILYYLLNPIVDYLEKKSNLTCLEYYRPIYFNCGTTHLGWYCNRS